MARLLGAGVLAVGLAFAALPASAQTQSSSTSAGAVANAIVVSGSGSGSGSNTVTYKGGVENVPSVYGALSVAPCTTAAQIGGAFLGGGFTASLGSESEGCSRRANAAAFHAMGRDDVAMALLAQDPNVAKALRDVEQAKLAAAQAQQAQQARFAPVMVAPAEPENVMVRPAGQQPMGQPRLQQVRAQVPAATAQRPDWCLRAAPTTQAGRDYVRQVCGQG
ncbi:hypothetical protein [Roseomonas gilardii]|uniref:hypothetical protein n=1 Tax=Roseomonas gilardii TaxID=257708 RepID=UPI0011C01915|nr:hypothetical protein [Roseomonas gilardii]